MKQILGLIVVLLLISCGSGNKQNTSKDADVQGEIVEMTFKVEGMHCTNCEKSIAKGVNELDGIEEVKSSHMDSTTFVKFDAQKTNAEKIVAQIEKRGYSVKGEI